MQLHEVRFIRTNRCQQDISEISRDDDEDQEKESNQFEKKFDHQSLAAMLGVEAPI